MKEALKTAETESAIVAVLTDCGKVSDMVRAYEELTGREYLERTVAIKSHGLGIEHSRRNIARARGREIHSPFGVGEVGSVK